MYEPGKVTISRVTDNRVEHDWIRITLMDEKHKQEVIVELSLTEYALAISGMGHVPCTFKNFRLEAKE